MLEPLKVEISLYEERIREANNSSGTTPRSENGYQMDATRLVGTRVKAYWSKNEVGNSGWTTGKKLIRTIHQYAVFLFEILQFSIWYCKCPYNKSWPFGI